MLNRILLGSRLALGFGILILAAVAAFAAAVASGRGGQNAISELARRASERQVLVDRMELDQLRIVAIIRNAGLQTDGGAINDEVADFHKVLKELEADEAIYGDLSLPPQEREVLDRARALRAQAVPLAEQAIQYAMALAGEEAAKLLTSRFAPLQSQWGAALAKLAQLSEQRTVAEQEEIRADNDRKALALAGILLAVAAGAAWFAFAVTRSVTQPLRTAADVASRVAAGDLSVQIEIKGRDETAALLESLRSMAQQLAEMVLKLRESSESVAASSAQITRGNLDLSARTERQAAALEQTAASVQGLAQMVERSSRNAGEARELASRSADVARAGSGSMEAVDQTMTRISESSRRIADIIGVIDGIAFQTNILALNAAVEAARAGDQGRGFAVVASEVRALAHRVTTAAREVRDLIGESVTRVGEGAVLVGRMGETMGELLASVSKVNELVAEISAAASEQNHSISEVNAAVREIDNSTQQNAAMVEQVAAAAQDLATQTEGMADQVRRFRVAA